MTFEQRMAELGVDLSDLNVDIGCGEALYEKYYELAEATADTKGIELNALLMIMLVLHDIAERDDIIDRMETRIVNLTGERDYLLDLMINYAGCNDCRVCLHRHPVIPIACSDESKYMTLKDGEFVACQFEYAGVSEDWRPDDD